MGLRLLKQWGFYVDLLSLLIPLTSIITNSWTYQLARLLRLRLLYDFHKHFCKSLKVRRRTSVPQPLDMRLIDVTKSLFYYFYTLFNVPCILGHQMYIVDRILIGIQFNEDSNILLFITVRYSDRIQTSSTSYICSIFWTLIFVDLVLGTVFHLMLMDVQKW